MEFWKIYRIIKARRWMILGLLLITLATVAIAYKALSENTQYTATTTVLPSQTAYAGVSSDTKNGGGILGPTYGRLDRMAQFIQDIKNASIESAVQESFKPTVEQKRWMVRSLVDRLGQIDPALPAAVENNDVLRVLPETVSVGTPDPATVAHVNRALVRAGILKQNELAHHSDIGVMSLDYILKYFNLPTDPKVWAPTSTQGTHAEEAQKVQQVRANLTASPVYESSVNTTPGTQLTPVITDYLQIGLTAPHDNEAMQMANLVAASFINDYKDLGVGEYSANIERAKAERKKAQVALDAARDTLTRFREKEPYVTLTASENINISNLQKLESSRDSALVQFNADQKSAATLEALAAAAGPTTVLNLDPMARPKYQQLQDQIADAQAALAALGADLTPDNPRYQKQKATLDSLIKERAEFLKQPYRNATANPEYPALKNQADAARADAARAQQTIATLTAQINLQRNRNQTLPQAENTLAKLTDIVSQAKLDLDKKTAILNQLNGSHELVNQGQISLEMPAASAVPDSSGPGLAALLIYGAILSLIIGIAAAVGLDYLDNSVQTIPDAEKLLGMPVSAVIPAMPPGDPRRLTRLTVSDPLSPIAESYRLLRTDLLFTAEEKPFKSLMAATAKPGQGATTTICNLAVALATVGKRVILIDADLRRPKLHSYFNVSNETGLTSLLRDECELEEALKVTDIDNLLVLPSGPLPLNPAELLASQKMRALHERLKPHTDFVLIDTPSAIAFSDSSILASYLDAVMIVVRAQETPRGSEVQLKQLLNKARANVVGVVLNGVKPQLVDSYYYHAAYYPQVTTNGHALEVAGNGGVLPPPHNGRNGHEGGSKTLEGDDVAEVVSSQPTRTHPNIEATAVIDGAAQQEDIVTVTPARPRSRFSLRRRSGDDDPS